MITPDFLDELARFEASLKREIHSIFQGEQRSPEVGEGLTFSDFRRYSPGDDTRLIDWKLYARTEELFIKQFEEERSLTLHVLLDGSASMDFGEGESNKFEYGAKIGLGFAYLIAEEQNDFRYHLLRDNLERLDSGRSNRGELLTIIDRLNEYTPEGQADLEDLLASYESEIHSKSLILVVSDFLERPEAIREGLAPLAEHDLHLVHVVAPQERSLPVTGDTIFEDLESDRTQHTYVASRLRQQYQHNLENHISQIQRVSEDLGARHTVVDTDMDLFEAFSNVWPRVQ